MSSRGRTKALDVVVPAVPSATCHSGRRTSRQRDLDLGRIRHPVYCTVTAFDPTACPDASYGPRLVTWASARGPAELQRKVEELDSARVRPMYVSPLPLLSTPPDFPFTVADKEKKLISTGRKRKARCGELNFWHGLLRDVRMG